MSTISHGFHLDTLPHCLSGVLVPVFPSSIWDVSGILGRKSELVDKFPRYCDKRLQCVNQTEIIKQSQPEKADEVILKQLGFAVLNL